jgi:hypothetical protein
MAIPAIVPSTVASVAAVRAMSSELAAAPSICSSANSVAYQRVVKPTHSALSSESLKEKRTTTASGR